MSPERDTAADQRTWRLWMAMVEQASRADALQAQLYATHASRSWRITAPLRALLRRLGAGGDLHRPMLQPAPAPVAPVRWLPATLAEAAHRGLAPGWMPANEAGPVAFRLFVDVSELALEDLGAGVQRVTRRVLVALLATPQPTLVIAPVRLSSHRGYVLARDFLTTMMGLPSCCLGEDAPFDAGPGHVLLALDFHREHAEVVGDAVAALRARGVATCFIAHDALPATHPEWLPASVADDDGRWLAMLSRCADAVLCICSATRDAVLAQLDAKALPHPPHGAHVFPLGSDPFPAAGTLPLPAQSAGSTRVLMVGTLEPHKGYEQALAAMELLWRCSQAFEIVLVGHAGWMTKELADRLRVHAEVGKRLHWFKSLDDRALMALYRQCDLLLHASRGEGYGLPIAKAGRACCTLLLRDLAVFKEVGADSADYFHGDSPVELADALQSGRDAPGARARPDVRRWRQWSDSADALMGLCTQVAKANVATNRDIAAGRSS